MNIIFRPHFFGGKNNNFDQIFVPLSLKSVLKYNPDSTIYFISNEPNFIEKFFPINPPTNLKCFVFEDFEGENTKEFNKNYVHLSHNPYLFEKFCTLSYFYIYNLMCKFEMNEVIIVETDVFVFCDLNSKIKSNFDINEYDAILANRNVMCSSYCKKIYFETFVNASLKMYSDIKIVECLKDIYKNMKAGGICDMTINDWINNNTVFGGLFTKLNSESKKINIKELSEILPDNSFFDNFLIHINYNNSIFDYVNSEVGVIKKIYNINNEPFFKINDDFIRCNSMHFQGHRKELMPQIYETYFNYLES
jgi:hypothetical protein